MIKIRSFMRKPSMNPPIITSQDSLKTLEKFLGSIDFVFITFELQNFHNKLQGLIGEHFILTVTYKDEEESKEKAVEFFVKTLSSKNLMKEFSRILQVYEKETFFYSLLEEYAKYNIDISFVPKAYYFRPHIVVLEDLSHRYKGTPKRESLNLDLCKSCLTAIAKFHASTIIYQKKKGRELDKHFSLKDDHPEILEDRFSCKEDNIATKWMMSSIEALSPLIDLLSESRVSKKMYKRKLMEAISADKSEEGSVYGLLHGDLWSSNFLHRYEGEKVVETKLIDYQLLKYGPLEQDVAEFLMTNTSGTVREEKFDSLVEHYFNVLKNVITQAGLDCDQILPIKEAFVVSCQTFQLSACIHAVVDHSYTYLPDEIYEKVLRTDELWQKFLFEERSKYLVDAFKEQKEFRRVIREDLLKIRDMLFP